jgi:hypothetical protein
MMGKRVTKQGHYGLNQGTNNFKLSIKTQIKMVFFCKPTGYQEI